MSETLKSRKKCRLSLLMLSKHLPVSRLACKDKPTSKGNDARLAGTDPVIALPAARILA